MWQTYGKMTGGQLTSFTRLYCQTQLYWHYALISLATCGPCWIDFVQHKASMLLICRPPNANLIWCQLWNDSHWPDSTSTIAFCICQHVHRLNAPMTLLHCMRKINLRLCYCVTCCSKINVQMNIGMQISCVPRLSAAICMHYFQSGSASRALSAMITDRTGVLCQ